MSCSSRRLRSVTSRPERTTPSMLPCSSDKGLKLKRIRRHSPDLWRARISLDAKVCLPSMRFLYSDRRAGKLLLLMEAAFHLTALGDVHERTLIAHYASGIVANGRSGIQAHDGSAVLANQGDLPALDHGLTVDLGLNDLSFCLVHEDFGNSFLHQFFPGIVAQHAHQRRIDVHNGPVRGGDVDAFLERFEEFRKAGFVLAECGDVVPQNGNAVDFAVAHYGMRDTIEVSERRLCLQPHLNNTRPLAAFHESGHGAPQ